MDSSICREHPKTPAAALWLKPHRDEFLAGLGRLNYASGTITIYRRAIDLFIEQAQIRGIEADDFDPLVLAELYTAVPMPQSESAQRCRLACIAKFIDHLAAIGVIAASPPSLPPHDPFEQIIEACGDWLRRERGLSQSTVRKRQSLLGRFLTFQFGTTPGDLNSIESSDIMAFLDLPPKWRHHGPAAFDKATNLRSLFRFLFAVGLTRCELSLAMPPIAVRRPTSVVLHLTTDEVRCLVGSISGDSAADRRSRAILLLMARLGLRAHEVFALRLTDFNWQAGEVLIRGKGKLYDRMPIPVDVGDAVADYVMNGRSGTAPHLFVSLFAPHRRLASTSIARSILEDAFTRTGLEPPGGRVRSHVLRFSLATNLLAQDVSLEEIGDILRHRSTTTTAIYARHDIRALRPLARPWPVRRTAK